MKMPADKMATAELPGVLALHYAACAASGIEPLLPGAREPTTYGPLKVTTDKYANWFYVLYR